MDQWQLIQPALPAVAALLLLAWILARVAKAVFGARRPASDAVLGAVVAGLAAGLVVGTLVAAIGLTEGLPWWGLLVAGVGAELLVAVLIPVLVGLRVRRRSRRRAGRPGTADAEDQAELAAALTRQLAEGGLLMAYAQLRMLLADHPEHRYGRAVAAELAGLVQSGAVTIESTPAQPPERVAVRLAADRPEVRHPEQRYLRRALGEPGCVVVLAPTRSPIRMPGDTRWDPLADALREEFKRRWTLGSTSRLLRLRRLMRRHVESGLRRFEDHPELYRLGLPYAILFGRDGRDPDWPWPPEGDPAWVPPSLIQACILATTFPGQECTQNFW